MVDRSPIVAEVPRFHQTFEVVVNGVVLIIEMVTSSPRVKAAPMLKIQTASSLPAASR
jgi:hypothetical protein